MLGNVNGTHAAAPTTQRAAPAPIEKPPSRRIEDDEVRPYILTGELGKGSFAIVYKGYHEQTRDQVAIKTVSKSILTSKLFDNLQSEIEILKSVSHRHITKLIDIVRAEKNIYLIMEYCSGGDLTNYIKKRGRVETLEYIPSPGAAPTYYPHPKTGGLDEIVVRSFLRQLGRALKFLRARNLIHRDIKPQNLLLKPASPEEMAKGHPLGVPILKIADFGFARSLPNAVMAETLCGSPLYMAPEILRYEKYGAKADLWSVGAVLYEIAVGRPPFRAQNHIDLLKKIEHSKGIKFPDEDPAAHEKEPDLPVVPIDIKKLIRALLKRLPVERCTFEEFFGSTAIAKSKFPRPGVAVSASGSGSVPSRTISRNSEQEPVFIGTMGKRPGGEVEIIDSPMTSGPAPLSPMEKVDPKVAIAPTKIVFRRDSENKPDPPSPLVNDNFPRSRKVSEDRPLMNGYDRPPYRRPNPGRILSTEGSIIPGETEEDGVLRREYVMVGDTRAIEVNQAVDEIITARRRPLRYRNSLSSPVTEKRQFVDHYPPDSGAAPSPNAVSFPPQASPMSSSPSRGSALTRALNLASKKLLGISRSPPRYPERESSRSPRKQALLLGARTEGLRDPLEGELLGSLEDLAQKTDALTRWADEMYEYVKAIPQKPLPRPAEFVRRDGESERNAARRKNADIEAEYNAVTCVALYILLMSFSQKGIDRLRFHHEGMKMRDPEGTMEVSNGFHDALAWFKDHFIKCNDRAALVKTWLPENYNGEQTWLDQLIYDRALQLSRKAARMEIVDHAPSLECERLYEESLWCLGALQDDVMQSSNPFQAEDRATIMSWIEKTKLRLQRCRARRAMNDGDRARDVQADPNLDEVRSTPHKVTLQ